MEGMRKFYMAVIVIAALVVGLVVMLLFKRFDNGMWTAWCAAVAGSGGAYAAANVVSKTVDDPKKGKRK
jgi:membrane associated rhomboid family serine protease